MWAIFWNIISKLADIETLRNAPFNHLRRFRFNNWLVGINIFALVISAILLLVRIDTIRITRAKIIVFLFLSILLCVVCYRRVKGYCLSSRREILFAKRILFVIPVLLILTILLFLHIQTVAGSKSRILIVKFVNDETAFVSGYIYDELYKVTKGIPEIKLLTIEDPNNLFKNEEQIIEIGKNYQADLVVWGTASSSETDKKKKYDMRLTLLKPVGKFYLSNYLEESVFFLSPIDEELMLSSEDIKRSRINVKFSSPRSKAYEVFAIAAFLQAFRKNWDAAINITNQAIENTDDRIDKLELEEIATYFYLGNANIDKAKKMSESLLERHPKNSDFQNLVGKIYLTEKKYDKAKEHFKLAKKYDSNNIDAINNLGVIYYLENSYSLALDEFNIIINEKKSNYINAIANRARVYFKQEEYKDAIEDMSLAVRLLEKKTYSSLLLNDYYFEKAKYYYKMRRYSLCIEDYSRIIKQNSKIPNNILSELQWKQIENIKTIQIAKAYKERGFIYKIMGIEKSEKYEFSKAFDDFGKAIDLLLQMKERNINIGFGEEVDINSKLAYYYSSRGFAYFKRGQIAPKWVVTSDFDNYNKKYFLSMAKSDFKKALEYDKNFEEFEEVKEAIKEIERILCQLYSDSCKYID